MPGQSAEAEQYQAALRTQGYIDVNHGMTDTDVNALFTSFRGFLNVAFQPDGKGRKFADALCYKLGGREGDGDYYVAQQRQGIVNEYSQRTAPTTDDKDTAQIGPHSVERAFDVLHGQMPKVMHEFLSSCVELHEATKRSARPVLRALGMEDSLLADNRLNDVHLVRLARYLASRSSHKAFLHFDRSDVSVAVAETSPGLVGVPAHNTHHHSIDLAGAELMAEQANQTPIDHSSGVGKLFLGAAYNYLPADAPLPTRDLPLLLHGALNHEPNEERLIAVVFMNQPFGMPGIVVPPQHETSFEVMYNHIARRS